ncbi:MAG: hypothetical protein ACOX0C_02350 [Patescibacteria group bacterium]|jgi:hypothetical protein
MSLTAKKLASLRQTYLTGKQRLAKNKKKAVVITLSSLGFLLVSYLLFAWLRVSPLAVALAELERSFAPQIVCHEECLLYRVGREELLVKALERSDRQVLTLLYQEWHREDLSLEFRRELLKIMSLGLEGAPRWLRDYLSLESADLAVSREILNYFPELAKLSAELKPALVARLAKTPSSAEKVELLKLLRALANDAEIEAYFTVLLSSDDLDYQREAVKNISNIQDKLGYFTEEQLAILKELIMEESLAASLRQELVLLVGDYYLVYPAASLSLWQEVYQAKHLDNISRLLAADSLNLLQKTNLSLPEVSAREWQEYYNN